MKRRAIAALLSGLACPGAGQIYNRQYIKGGILVAATLAMVAVLFFKVWGAMLDAVASVPPDELLSDVFGLAHRIVEGQGDFYGGLGWAFFAVWLYGVVDAYVMGGRENA